MPVNGGDCAIVIKTLHLERDIPFSDETLREAVSFLREEAAVEGDGVCRGILKSNGVTGVVTAPLTIGTAPLLLCLALGAAGNPVFVSETRNVFRYELNLLPLEDSERFHLIQDRGGERRFFEGCRAEGFELRVMRDEPVKLKLEIYGECAPGVYPSTELFNRGCEERFNGDCVTYSINGRGYTNIYGITLMSRKRGGTKTELWVKRALQQGGDVPGVIEEMTVTARLLRDRYEYRSFGTFRITLKGLVLIGDETEVNASGAVISPLRFYVSGGVFTEVFTSSGELIP